MKLQTCTLCGTGGAEPAFAKNAVTYHRCAECGLVFMDPEHWPSLSVELARYSEHNNDGNDPGYVKHLMDIGGRVARAVEQGAAGLDYGCGPSPVMGAELTVLGLTCDSYDPIFFDDRALLRQRYDFVTCCEAVEHFHYPSTEFIKLYNLLGEGGVLGIKTALLEDDMDLESWYYANDWTHVSFYTEKTIDWIAEHFRLDIVERESGRVVFRKQAVQESVPVVAGVISNGDLWLAARRSAGHMAGKWEFPGGKVRSSESDGDALKRELLEEMQLNIEPGVRLGTIEVPNEEHCIELRFIECRCENEPVCLTDHSEWKWASPADCLRLEMAPGDMAFVQMYGTRDRENLRPET